MPQNSVVKWRQIALQFHAIRTELAVGNLGAECEPVHLAELLLAPQTGAIRAVFSFLLHMWSAANQFELGEVQRWDSDHCKAFGAWVDGSITGQPCHYF